MSIKKPDPAAEGAAGSPDHEGHDRRRVKGALATTGGGGDPAAPEQGHEEPNQLLLTMQRLDHADTALLERLAALGIPLPAKKVAGKSGTALLKKVTRGLAEDPELALIVHDPDHLARAAELLAPQDPSAPSAPAIDLPADFPLSAEEAERLILETMLEVLTSNEAMLLMEQALDETTEVHPDLLATFADEREAEQLSGPALKVKASRMIQRIDATPATKENLLAALEMVAGRYNALAAMDWRTLFSAEQGPVLEEARAMMGEEWIHRLNSMGFDGLRIRLEALMRDLFDPGVEGVIAKKGKKTRRQEKFVTELQDLLEYMIGVFKDLGETRLFPQKSEFTEVKSREYPHYRAIKKAIMGMAASFHQTGSINDASRSALTASLEQAGLNSPKSVEEWGVFVQEWIQKIRPEFIVEATTEELADHIVEQILMIEINHMVAEKQGQPGLPLEPIVLKIYTLIYYYLHHLRNSLAGQVLSLFEADPDMKPAKDFKPRLFDFNCQAETVPESDHRLQVITKLLITLSKCLRCLQTMVYQQALLNA